MIEVPISYNFDFPAGYILSLLEEAFKVCVVLNLGLIGALAGPTTMTKTRSSKL